jgi:hypothetical protein
MGDYSGSADAGVPAGQLFGYLSDISNLPRYFTAMTSAEPAGQDEVHVVADAGGATREAEAWFRVDRERRHLEWGSEGPGNYHGSLDVTGDGATASVRVFLHTERAGSGDIGRGIASTPRRNQAAGGSGPGARSRQLRDRPGATAEQGHGRRALPPAVTVTARKIITRALGCGRLAGAAT